MVGNVEDASCPKSLGKSLSCTAGAEEFLDIILVLLVKVPGHIEQSCWTVIQSGGQELQNGLGDFVACLARARLAKVHVQRLGFGLALHARHLALARLVGLVADEDLIAARVTVLVDDVHPNVELVESFSVRHVVDEKNTVSTCENTEWKEQ